MEKQTKGNESFHRKLKQSLIEGLKSQLDDTQMILLCENEGVGGEDITLLRKNLREAGGDHKVVKNRLLKLAVKDTEFQGIEAFLKGKNVFTFIKETPVECAKVITEFLKEKKKYKLKGGIWKGKVLGEDQIKEIAALPSREQLIGQLAGVLHAPLRNLAGVLNASIQNLALALNAVKDKKEA